jgi:hypothetical protein
MLDAAAPDAADTAGVPDVGQRVSFDEEQVGAQAGLDRAAVAETEDLGRP